MANPVFGHSGNFWAARFELDCRTVNFLFSKHRVQEVRMRYSLTDHPFTVLTWNVNFRRASVLEVLTSLHNPPDILTLQEISVEQADSFRKRLSEMGLQNILYSGRADSSEKRYGNIIASRWPLESVDWDSLKASLPWPQLVAHGVIRVGGSLVNVITAHVPNGAGNGWAKIDTLRVLAKIVEGVKGSHCIVTGDFNEPQFALQDDRIVTFGQEKTSNGTYRCWNQWEFKGRSGTGEEWDSAVRWFFENRDDHGLRHAFWDASGYGSMEPSHISRGNPRWFDHIFITEGFRVDSCNYLHDVRLKGWSDHSASTAQIAYRSQ
jgi:endonuclease/exonuclease/phosphatase family metal-dependent hydrolase